MDLVIDTSALLAVILGEPERKRIIQGTSGCTLVAPASLPWEIGNAFSAMLKQRRMGLEAAQRGLEAFLSVPLRYLEVDLRQALVLADRAGIYAYDAYFLDCSLRYTAPLLTLDRTLQRAAGKTGVSLVEV